MSSFMRGVVTGVVFVIALIAVVAGFRFFYERDRKIYEVWERYNEVREMREGVVGRDALEFLDDPGVRGAAGDGVEGFRGRRDEILQRFGSGTAD